MLTSGDDFPAAIESLARRYGIPLPTKSPAAARRQRREQGLGEVLEAAEEFFRANLGKYEKPRRYLERRRISNELIDSFRIGYAPAEWRALKDSLTGRFGVEALEKAGLLSRSPRRPEDPFDRFRDRLMFPIRTTSGQLVGFGGRTLGDDKAKYINTAETSRFQKGRILYGLERAKRALRESRTAILVEGYFDVLGVAAAGLEGAVASMGTALTAEQCKLMARFSDQVVVAYDADDAGEKAFRRALPVLLSAGLAVLRPALPRGLDPDAVRLEEGPERLAQLIDEAADAVTREIRRLAPLATRSDPRIQARAARSVVELLRAIPDSVLRYGYAKQAADRLGLPVNLLLERLKKTGHKAPRERERRRDSPVRSIEERVLEMLLAGRQQLAVDELPPPATFLDPEYRNIYRVYLDLYSSSGRVPESREVLSGLSSEDGSVDRIARLLLEQSAGSDRRELMEALRQLRRRWQQQQLKELAAKIREAQQQKDDDRLQQLLDEKAEISRALHLSPPNGQAERDDVS